MDKTFFELPDILTIPHKTPSHSKDKTTAPTVPSEGVDLSMYLIPVLQQKDTPKVTHYSGYSQTNSSKASGDDPILHEKHVWVEKRLFNAPGAEKLYLYSVRDEFNQLKQINNFYSIYPKLLKSEPSMVIEGKASVSWEYDRLVDIGQAYPFVNDTQPATATFEVARRLDTYTTAVNKRIKRTDTDVIEILYRVDGAITYKEYFAKRQGIISTVTPDYVLLKQDR